MDLLELSAKREWYDECEFRYSVSLQPDGDGLVGAADIWIKQRLCCKLAMLHPKCSEADAIALVRSRCLAWLEMWKARSHTGISSIDRPI